MVFFLNADEKVYARYGGRDAESPDGRQSLAGLRYTMQSVLDMQGRAEKSFAPRSADGPRLLRPGLGPRAFGRCQHCHQVKETLNADLRRAGKWSRDLVWRYPPPVNLGFDLEVDRGNVVRQVRDRSPAAAAGLKAGDVVRRLHGVPIHSYADAQFALDRALGTGSIEVVWQRGDKVTEGRLALPAGWRKTDISWRPSMQDHVPCARLYGTDLTAAEKKALGLAAGQLAFRQKHPLSAAAGVAGVRQGDVIVGIDDQTLETDVAGFHAYVRGHYLVGDRVTLHLLRDGQRRDVRMVLPP
jgi:S1-C subfamily serine protease